MDKRHEYSMVIQWNVPRNTYLVIIPELPRCRAYGETYEKAVQNAQESIKMWIAEQEALGLPVPEPDLWNDQSKSE